MASLLELLNNLFATAQNFIWSYFVLGLLIAAGIYFTLSFRFIQLRKLKEMLRLLKQAPVSHDGHRSISSFQAFTISAASRVGTGNIAGVALAIVLGGPGAVFWMWVMAGFGAASAFIEATLAQVYKKRDPHTGTFIGGPAYYIERGLNQRWLGVVFAVLLILTFGVSYISIQSNTIAQAMETYHVPHEGIGMILAALTAVIIFGGVRRLVKFTSWCVPILALLYLALALYVVLANISEVPSILALIVRSAFGLEEFAGGTIGAATAMLLGVKRGLFSNEAGEGSAPHAAAAASVSHPVKQGLIQTLGVYFDTWLVCTATAIIILLYPDLQYGGDALSGIKLTQQALTYHFGSWGGLFLTVSIFLFAYSSVIGNYFYAETNTKYLFKHKSAVSVLRVITVVVVYLGAVAGLELVWNIGDFFMALITTINLIAIISLSHVVYAVTADYVKQLRAGKEPEFELKNISSDLSNIDCWGEPK
ncbi:sodium:alanine symporter family protein [Pasteurellaceae bacterium LIM206]|nr:sodium:alanine symporter family protein [Pasteurellaceae bacterium LIM206]